MSEIETIRDDHRLVLSHIGEGYFGDYDEDDPEDAPLLRFDLYEEVDGDWEMVDGCSYCTWLSDDLSEEIKQQAVELLMDKIHEAIKKGISERRVGARLSWVSYRDGQFYLANSELLTNAWVYGLGMEGCLA